MKKYYRLLVIFLVLSCWIPYVATAQVVRVPDANLAAALRGTLGLAPNAPITRQDMQRLGGFLAVDTQIRNLIGLEHATRLRVLHLHENQIRDVSPLSGLTQLEVLNLRQNQISNINPLSGLTQLEALSLSNNQVSNISPLAGLTQLKVLHFSTNKINDIRPLIGLTQLEELVLNRNQISDVSPLARLTQLQSLAIRDNKIKDISPLARLIQLVELGLAENQISNLRPLTGLTQLKVLDLPQNQIRDVSPLAGLTQLRLLSLINNQISDVSPLAGLVNLTYLLLAGNPITDTSPLARLTKLVQIDVRITAPPTRPVDRVAIPDPNLAAAVRGGLDLGPNAPITKQVMQRLTTLDAFNRQIKDLTGLENATRLKELSLNGNQISDLSSLTGLTQLERLLLTGSQIRNVSPLAGLTQLKVLALGRNQISDVSPLTRLTRLEVLFLNGNQIRDVSPLAALVNLETLSLAGNPITDTSPLANLTKLVEVDVEITAASTALIPDTNLAAAVRETLDLGPNAPITEQTMQRLIRLWAGSRQIKDLTGLEHAIQLEELSLGYNQIRDIRPLIGMTKLRRLFLGSNQISDVSPLAGLTRLKELSLSRNDIRDVSPLAELVNLERLLLVGNPITDTSPLANLTKLVEVDVEISTIADATDTTVSVSPAMVVSPLVGEQLTFSLNIANGKKVAGYQGTISYDTSALRYVESNNGDYLPAGAFFVPPVVNGNRVKFASTALTGVSNGDGTLATLTFEVVAAKASTLTLTDVLLADSNGDTVSPQVESGQITEPEKVAEDVNSDGVVNIQDLVLVASNFGQTGANAADVNGDGVVNITDLVKVAGALGNAAAAPSLSPEAFAMFTTADVRKWLTQAQHINLTDVAMQRGIHFLEQLLGMLIPKESALLPNYPNPFNPETWIPYQLAKPADVTLTIYQMNGHVVRQLSLGHQLAGTYQSKGRAAYWDGRNALGEPVASGIYFYTLTAADFIATRKMLIRK